MKDLKPGDLVRVYVVCTGIQMSEKSFDANIAIVAGNIIRVNEMWVHRRQCVPLRPKRKALELWMNITTREVRASMGNTLYDGHHWRLFREVLPKKAKP